MIIIGNNVYLMQEKTTELEPDIEEEDRLSLPDRIKEAVEEYGCVFLDRETADRFFHAKWNDFVDAIGELRNKGYSVKSFIEKENV